MGGRSGGTTSRIDRPVLEAIRDRLATAPQFDRATITHERGQLRLEVRFDDAATPPAIEERVLDVRWYTNDDFRIHYTEQWPDRRWMIRWDRHPNSHNSREHYHPPPDATTPGLDRTWADDYRDVCSTVLEALRDRTATLWEKTE